MSNGYREIEAGCRRLRAALEEVSTYPAVRSWALGFLEGDLDLIERELQAAPDRALHELDVAACPALAETLDRVAERLLSVQPPTGFAAPSLEQEQLVLTAEDRRVIHRFYEIARG